jgi:cytochrome P450
MFLELAKDSNQQEALVRELSGVDIYDRNQLQALPHLNGVINESLRMHPAVPSGGYR